MDNAESFLTFIAFYSTGPFLPEEIDLTVMHTMYYIACSLPCGVRIDQGARHKSDRGYAGTASVRRSQ